GCRPRGSTLFPYTTLFRSVDVAVVVDGLTHAEWKAIQSDAAEIGVSNELPLSVLALSTERYEQMIRVGGVAQDIVRDGNHLLVRSEEHTSELQSPDHLVCR